MTISGLLDWTVALFVCGASLTAIVQTPNDAAQCDAPTAIGRVAPLPALPPSVEIDAMIRDMKLHD